MKDLSIPGLSVAVIRDGKVIKLQGYGLANAENSVPTTPETAYLLASVTKQFTAAAIMMLEEEGKLALDDPISKSLREPPDAWKEITIRELLGHTADLKDRFLLPAGRISLYTRLRRRLKCASRSRSSSLLTHNSASRAVSVLRE
jgi:CubicO group peptidase (beta-lactamase class C family)